MRLLLFRPAGGGGSGTKTKVVIATDLPLQGASADASRDTNRAVQMIVDAYNAYCEPTEARPSLKLT